VEASEVALGHLVVSSRDAPPCLQLVDQALDGVPLLVETGVVTWGPAAPAAFPLPVGSLVPLLRDDWLDVAFVQVRPVGAG
jgi:hypothetical protein